MKLPKLPKLPKNIIIFGVIFAIGIALLFSALYTNGVFAKNFDVNKAGGPVEDESSTDLGSFTDAGNHPGIDKKPDSGNQGEHGKQGSTGKTSDKTNSNSNMDEGSDY